MKQAEGGSWWTAPELQQNRALFMSEVERRQPEIAAGPCGDDGGFLVLGPMIPAHRKRPKPTTEH
jgi:hypothetical protein